MLYALVYLEAVRLPRRSRFESVSACAKGHRQAGVSGQVRSGRQIWKPFGIGAIRAPMGGDQRARVFAQLSYKQIGELFGKTENWACVTYHRARGMIRTGLEENENEK